MRLVTIFLFIFWTSIRHESSHALVAYLEGAEILELKLLPGIHKELGFYFGYVKHRGNTTWLTEAAPFITDTIVILITYILLKKNYFKSSIRYFLLFGFISPIADLIYNYQGGLWRTGTDVSDLFQLLPNAIVHIFFLSIISVSIYLYYYFRKKQLQ